MDYILRKFILREDRTRIKSVPERKGAVEKNRKVRSKLQEMTGKWGGGIVSRLTSKIRKRSFGY
jgi:hypothetical protein